MRRLMVIALVGLLASPGCTFRASRTQMGVQLPTGEAAERVHDWSVLRRLPQRTHLLVELDSGRLVDARVEAVSDSGLTVLQEDSHETLASASVLRVVRIDSVSSIRAKQGVLGGLVVGGSLLFLTGGGLWIALAVDPAALAAFGALTGVSKQRQSLVYERR